MKNLSKIIVACFITLNCVNVWAQNNNDKKARQAALTAQRVNEKNFVFNADYVTPARGGGRSLTSQYDLTVTKDSIIAYLPYFGRAYLAPPYGSMDNGIKFTWTNFTYKVTVDKKKGFDILIKPVKEDISDANGVRFVRLSVGANGYASLQVINSNRDPITFEGTVEGRHQKKDDPTPY